MLVDIYPYDYAYKLMALYVNQEGPIPVNLYQLLHQLMISAFDADKEHPLHELFLVKLRWLPRASMLEDRLGWSQFVKKEKMRALPLLQEAVKIESQIAKRSAKRAPRDLDEANSIWLECLYQRANEDIGFAKLCKYYQVSEERFNQCLNYMASGWPKKESDHIPDIKIDGVDSALGLCWVKLPTGDKRGLILGDITACCQSIGGDSEACVMDAVSLQHNGLYVLLKQKNVEKKPVIINGEINEKDYKIVGQSYVWRSEFGNICLDSLECLAEEVSEDAVQSILSDFATRLLAENPTINYVTLGKGGKTPEQLFPDAAISELIYQGHQYGDAYEQYCIAKRVFSKIEKHPELEAVFSFASDDAKDYLFRYINIEILDALFVSGPHAINNQELMKTHSSDTAVIGSLILLSKMGLLTQTNVTLVLKHPQFENIFKLLVHYHAASMFKSDQAQDNLSAILISDEPNTLASIFSLLDKIGLLSGEEATINRQAVIHHQYRPYVVPILEKLNQIDFLKAENSKKTLNAILSHKAPYYLNAAIYVLLKTNLLKGDAAQHNFDALVDSSNEGALYPLGILGKLGLLKGDAAQHNFDGILRHKNPSAISRGLETLQNTSLFNSSLAQNHFDALISCPNSSDVVSALDILNKASLLNDAAAQEHLEMIFNHPNPLAIASALQDLNKLGLLTKSTREAIRSHNDPVKFAATLMMLDFNAGFKLGDDLKTDFNTIMRHKDPISLVQSLQILHQTGLLTEDNAKSLDNAMTAVHEPIFIINALSIIEYGKLLEGQRAERNLQDLLQHKNISGVVEVITTIHSYRCFEASLFEGELAQKNFNAIIGHQDLNFLNECLIKHHAQHSEPIDQSIFDKLITQKQIKTIAFFEPGEPPSEGPAEDVPDTPVKPI